MVKKIMFICTLLSAFLMSCSADLNEPSKTYSLTACIEESSPTRTSMSGDGIVRWSDGDELSVISGSSISTAVLTSGAGTASGTFSYSGTGTAQYAVYPASVASVSGSTAVVSLPSVQTYTDASAFASNTAIMGGKLASGSVLMKNAISILELQLTGTQAISSIVVTSLAKCLAGQGTVDMSSDAPVFVPSDGQSHSVTLTMPEPVQLSTAASSFFIVLPAAEYSDFTISVSGSEGSAVFASTSTHSLQRSHVCKLKPMSVALTGGETYTWTLNATRYASSDWATSGTAADDSGNAQMKWCKTNDDSCYSGAVTYSGTKSNNTYMVKSIWTGDCFEFTLPVRNFVAGSAVSLAFTPVSNTTGPRHWYVQYKDAGVWKTAVTNLETLKDNRCEYGFIPSTTTSSAQRVTNTMYFSEDIASGDILLRISCASGEYPADGTSSVMSQAKSTAGIYFKTGTTISAAVTAPGTQVPFLAVSPLSRNVSGGATSVELTINTNQSWSISSSADWITAETPSGTGYAKVKLQCAESTSEEVGEVTISASGLSQTVYVSRTVKLFTNPIGSTPDPYVWKEGSTYWFIKSNGSNGINISSSPKLSVLNSTTTIWTAPTGDEWNVAHVWGPELYRIDGIWYIYYIAGRPESEEGNYYKQRCGVLRCTDANPKTGTWEDLGQLNTGGYYSIDFTTFVYGGQRYAVWSGSPNATDIPQQAYIAKMSNPYTISSERVCLSQCSLQWEMVQGRAIQEGFAVLEHNGRIFLVYSCNGSWTKYYRLGMLTLTDGADPMDPSSWTKSTECVFYRCDDTADVDGVNGVGHCSFTKSPDGTEDWMIYHTKKRNDPTYTTGRATFIQKVNWKADGTPDFGTPCGFGESMNCPSGE